MGTTTVTTCGTPMALLHLSSLVSVKLKYVGQKSNSSLLYFRRRIPGDIKPLLAAAGAPHAGKIHYVVSLQASDPRVPVPQRGPWASLIRSVSRSPVRSDLVSGEWGYHSRPHSKKNQTLNGEHDLVVCLAKL